MLISTGEDWERQRSIANQARARDLSPPPIAAAHAVALSSVARLYG